MQNSKHGGDIYRNKIEYDFSVNINPLGVPDSVRNALLRGIEMSMCYPDYYSEELIRAIKDKLVEEGLEGGEIVVGNGASELFTAIVHALMPEKIGIVVPSFYGYEHAADVAGAEILFYELNDEQDFAVCDEICSKLDKDIDVLFLANPNNPTGRLIESEVLSQIAEFCECNDIILILDECFIEFVDGRRSFVEQIHAYSKLIIVRAYTKIFSIPGVRLGYLVTGNRKIADSIRKHIPEWNISVFAQEAGVAASKEMDFIEKTKDYVKKERNFLIEEINRIGKKSNLLKVVSGEVNFILLYSESELYNRLLEKGILIRDCSNFRGLSKGYYRIAVRTHEENCKLIKELEDIWERDRK